VAREGFYDRHHYFKEQHIDEVVATCLEIGLFDAGVYEATNMLTSKAIQRRFFMIASRRTYLEIPNGVLLLPDDSIPTSLTIIIKDLKVKESKVKDVTETQHNAELLQHDVTKTPKLPIKQKKKRANGPTAWHNMVITKDDLAKIAHHPDYGAGDMQVVKNAWLDLRDWAEAKGARKKDWTATLRGWIRRNKQNQRYQPKTFAQIDQDNFEQACNDFMTNTGE